jgi:hypothetical protein
MNKETKSKGEEFEEITGETEDVLDILKPKMQEVEGGVQLFFDEKGIKHLNKILNQKEEIAFLSNDLLGLQCHLKSSTLRADKLLNLIEKSIKKQLKTTPTRIPLGVS